VCGLVGGNIIAYVFWLKANTALPARMYGGVRSYISRLTPIAGVAFPQVLTLASVVYSALRAGSSTSFFQVEVRSDPEGENCRHRGERERVDSYGSVGRLVPSNHLQWRHDSFEYHTVRCYTYSAMAGCGVHRGELRPATRPQP
jgi:hypothetical protein